MRRRDMWICYRFEEKRGRATKENSPFKGRPRIRFVSENEKEEYLKQKEEYYKKD